MFFMKHSRRNLLKHGIALTTVIAGGGLLLTDPKLAKASGGGYYRGILPSGSVLVPSPRTPNEVVSNSYQLYLILQSDGNLVLYQCGTALWSSNTHGIAVTSCNMQTDGNLVIYAGAGNPIWASNTNGKYGAHLEVQDDGNLVIYDYNHNPIWATGTRANPGVICGG